LCFLHFVALGENNNNHREKEKLSWSMEYIFPSKWRRKLSGTTIGNL